MTVSADRESKEQCQPMRTPNRTRKPLPDRFLSDFS